MTVYYDIDYETNSDAVGIFVSGPDMLPLSAGVSSGVHSIPYHSSRFEALLDAALSVLGESGAKSEIMRRRNKYLGVANLASELCAGFKVIHPVSGKEMDLASCIIKLNDQHGWTREQIADWLDTLPEQPVMRVND